VIDLSGVDVRSLDTETISPSPQLIVCDLSFIGLAKALGPALALADDGADLVCLVKPQFEAAGPSAIGKGGLVRDAGDQQQALDAVCAWLTSQGWTVRETTDSPILGGDGNREFLLWATRT
jgi:23S rRNA (cytidine1920-2'-O)/16S rRNA (cytidine1409-2'-O)-methyltransferase